MEIKRILSGITTSGRLHLGNYLGAIRHWLKLQDKAQNFLFLADLHAITTSQKPDELHANILDTVIVYLACGLDPKKSTIFAQSSVYPHAELAWLFSCVARMGWLNRMTQFKEKSGKNKEQAFLGLYSYPVLQAADILLYQPTHVPVGEDQKQHIELARDIAQSFNSSYGNLFTMPEPLILGEATRVMSLRDGTKKMSKSDISDYARINLDDDSDTIKLKIQKAKSDSDAISAENLENRPELNNLVIIYSALADLTKDNVINKFSGKGFSELKKELAELMISKIDPISQEIQRLRNDKAFVIKILQEGKERALETAEPTLKKAKELMGFINF
ncbi:MAG: tryptophan--tRNA ligase [Sphingobacteriia bacterium]|nr:tryptophan--tRNA ligase [Sphingobacteriia bacterium]